MVLGYCGYIVLGCCGFIVLGCFGFMVLGCCGFIIIVLGCYGQACQPQYFGSFHVFLIHVIFQEHYLPFILQSKVKLMLQGDENQQSLLNFVDSSMKVPDRKLILEVIVTEEISKKSGIMLSMSDSISHLLVFFYKWVGMTECNFLTHMTKTRART